MNGGNYWKGACRRKAAARMRRGRASSSLEPMTGQQGDTRSRWTVPCPGGMKLRCCSCRTWMFFCCETLVMLFITTLAVLYIAHFTGKLAEGGAEVVQQREYANLHYHRWTTAKMLASSTGMANRSRIQSGENNTVSREADNGSSNGESEPPLTRQVAHIMKQFSDYVSTHTAISNRLENITLGKILAASAQKGAWSNVMYLGITFQLADAETTTANSNEPAAVPPSTAATSRPRWLGPMKHSATKRVTRRK